MKKGFTLVELLAVIAILAVILLIATVNVSGLFTKTKTDVLENQKATIIKAAKSYYPDNSYSVTFVSDKATILLSDLITAGYLTDDLVNPTTGVDICLASYVEITKNGNVYTYDVILYDDGEGPCS